MKANDYFKYKKRIVVKIGSSSLHHPNTGETDLIKIEKLVRELCDLRNQGYDVCLVSSGAIAVGRNALGLHEKPKKTSVKQACAAVGQAQLMMIYQKMFAEYGKTAAQILLTKYTILNAVSMEHAQNTFEEIFRMGIVPVVNENDTISTYEIHFGDNDTLSALVTSMVNADLLILLSDIDGLYTDDPRTNPNAEFVEIVDHLDDHYADMAKQSTGSDVGSGGMQTKLDAARIATASGADMIIANGNDVGVIHRIMEGDFHGTFFRGRRLDDFDLRAYLRQTNFIEGNSSPEELIRQA